MSKKLWPRCRYQQQYKKNRKNEARFLFDLMPLPLFSARRNGVDQPSGASRVSHRSTNSWSDPRELRLLQVPSA